VSFCTIVTAKDLRVLGYWFQHYRITTGAFHRFRGLNFFLQGLGQRLGTLPKAEVVFILSHVFTWKNYFVEVRKEQAEPCRRKLFFNVLSVLSTRTYGCNM